MNLRIDLNLNLPMLNRFHLNENREFQKLTLNSPSLKKSKLEYCGILRLDFAHPESVETLLIEKMRYLAVNELKNEMN